MTLQERGVKGLEHDKGRARAGLLLTQDARSLRMCFPSVANIGSTSAFRSRCQVSERVFSPFFSFFFFQSIVLFFFFFLTPHGLLFDVTAVIKFVPKDGLLWSREGQTN